jgi:hypothetical protein
LSNCQQVRTIFHEGVLWVDGSRDTTKEMARLCKAMGVQRKCGETWTECWRGWAREPERHILVILDGVDTPTALRPWVSEIGGQVVVLVTTRQAWRVERVLAQWLGSKTILGFGMCGLSPEEGHHLVNAGSRRQLTDDEWTVMQEIGEQVGWHAQTLLLAAAERHPICWQGQTDELRSGGMPFPEITELVKRQCATLDPREFDWLAAMANKTGSAWFGVTEAATTWQVTEAVAERRLWGLSGTGMVEMWAMETHEPPLEARWRVAPVVGHSLLGAGEDGPNMISLSSPPCIIPLSCPPVP